MAAIYGANLVEDESGIEYNAGYPVLVIDFGYPEEANDPGFVRRLILYRLSVLLVLG